MVPGSDLMAQAAGGANQYICPQTAQLPSGPLQLRQPITVQASGGAGTNQYAQRGRAKQAEVESVTHPPDLLGLLLPAKSVRYGAAARALAAQFAQLVPELAAPSPRPAVILDQMSASLEQYRDLAAQGGSLNYMDSPWWYISLGQNLAFNPNEMQAVCRMVTSNPVVTVSNPMVTDSTTPSECALTLMFKQLLSNPGTPLPVWRWQVEQLRRQSGTDRGNVQLLADILVKNKAFPTSELIDWLIEQAPRRALRRRDFPVPRMEQLARHPAEKIRWTAAKHLGRSAGALQRLAQDPKPRVRIAVAENPNTPDQILDYLAQDHVLGVRHAVARNTHTSASTLSRLAAGNDPAASLAVAVHPNAPAGVLVTLAQDKDPAIRRGVAWNANTPATTLERLLQDQEREVQRAAANNPNLPAAARAFWQLVHGTA